METRSNTTSKELLLKIKELQPELKKRFSVRSIGLFGSTATGLSNEQSDVDILVELDELSNTCLRQTSEPPDKSKS